MNFKPMLAATWTEHHDLTYPYLASPKLDGIRCIILEGIAVSRSLKPIRNKWIQACLKGLPSLDGELIVGDPTAPDCFNATSSGVMSVEGKPDFKYYVFDSISQYPFSERLATAFVNRHSCVVPVVHHDMHHKEDFQAYERDMLYQGYEGIMLRDPMGHYKYGRATPNENTLWKVKRFEDGEMMITHVLEGQSNENPPTSDALGGTIRSTHKENMVPNGKVGTICGYDMQTKASIDISPGKMTHDVRSYMWRHQNELVGKIAKYKWFKYGAIDAPRFATFQSLRDPEDMS